MIASPPATRSAPAQTRPSLHLILGPTGVGKTGRAVKAASDLACPVIALDRIQCHREIAVGSGRPTSQELGATTRHYLLEARPLAQGPIAAEPAIDRLVRMQRHLLSTQCNALILEGGSISLLSELLRRSDWHEAWSLHVTVCVEGSARAFEACIAARVEQMLGTGAKEDAGPTLQGELAGLWPDPWARTYAGEVVGYREAIALCDQQGLTGHDLAAPYGRLWRSDLEETIRTAHLTYARQQRQAIATALPTLTDLAKEIHLCEI